MNKGYCYRRGITLIELMITLAVFVVLIVIGGVSYSHLFSQHALLQRTDRVYHFLRLANSQAVKFNKRIYVPFCQLGTTGIWKMAMSEQAYCDCFSVNSCQLNGVEVVEDLADGKVIFTSPSAVTFANDQVSFSPMRFGINPGSVTLSDVSGTKLKVIQSTMRLKVCSPEKDQLGYKKC